MLRLRLFALLTVLFFLTYACKKDKTIDSDTPQIEVKTAIAPAVITQPITDIKSTTAIGGGNVISDGGAEVFARGICWNTSPEPTIADTKTRNRIGTGIYTSNLIHLLPRITYYVRAYAINDIGITYGNEISFSTVSAITDIQGNIYTTVKIGAQEWMAENLRTTLFNDSSIIQYEGNSNAWGAATAARYCYGGEGILYNWYAVESGNLCPTGWHVPSVNDWEIMIQYLGGNEIAGGKLKEAGTTHWLSPNLGATNETNFTALPDGFRDYYSYNGLSEEGRWWTSTINPLDNSSAYFYQLNYNWNSINDGDYIKAGGNSVRCVKD